MQGVLNVRAYKHFCALHVAICILISPDLSKDRRYVEYARALLVEFIKRGTGLKLLVSYFCPHFLKLKFFSSPQCLDPTNFDVDLDQDPDPHWKKMDPNPDPEPD